MASVCRSQGLVDPWTSVKTRVTWPVGGASSEAESGDSFMDPRGACGECPPFLNPECLRFSQGACSAGAERLPAMLEGLVHQADRAIFSRHALEVALLLEPREV